MIRGSANTENDFMDSFYLCVLQDSKVWRYCWSCSLSDNAMTLDFWSRGWRNDIIFVPHVSALC